MSAVPLEPSQAVYAIILKALTKHGGKVALRWLYTQPMIMQALDLGPLKSFILRIDSKLIDFLLFLILVLVLALLDLYVHSRVKSVLLRDPWQVGRYLYLLIQL